MNHPLSSFLAVWLALITACPAATLTVSNTSSGGNGFHGIATEAGALLAPGQARGVLGRLALTDGQITALVTAGDLEGLHAAFQPVGTDFALDLSDGGPNGAFEKSVTADLRESSNSLGGSPVHLWIYLGNDRTAASQYLLARLNATFPTDAEEAPPAFASLNLRPDTLDALHAGSLAGLHDYGLGSGSLTTLRLQPPSGGPNRIPVANDKSLQVLAGVASISQVTASDADMDDLEFIQTSVPAKGQLTFNVDGSFTYTAGAGQSGQDSFTFKVNDGKTDSDPATVTFQIQNGGKLAQTIHFEPPTQIDSDEGSLPLSATASSELPVSFELLAGPATLEGSILTLTGATGTLHVRAIQAGNATYDEVSLDRLIHVIAPGGAFTLGNLQQVYQGIPLHVSVQGAPPEEVILTYNGEADPPIHAGTYSVVALHNEARKTAKLVIAKSPLTVTADDQQRLIGEDNPELTFLYEGFLGEDNAETVFPEPASKSETPPMASTNAKSTSPGGAYPIRLNGGAARNYTLVLVPGTLVVNSFDGRYEILLEDPDTERVTAKIELSVGKTIKNGAMAFSGKLWTPTESAAIPLKGTLVVDANTETASTTLAFARGDNTYELDLELDLEGSFLAELRVQGEVHSSGITGRSLHVFGKAQLPPSLGTHTLILAPGTRANGGSRDLPAGAGHATGLFSTQGALKLVGSLADGTPFTASLLPSADGVYRLYVNPYKRPDSYLAGHLPITAHPDLTDQGHVAAAAGEFLVWTKAEGSKDKSHRAGIDLLDCALRLDPWRKPAKASRTSPEITLLDELGLPAENGLGVAHSDLPGIATAELPASMSIAANGKIGVLDPVENPAAWQVTLNTANGAFKGKFTLSEGKKRTVLFSGVLSRTLSTDPDALVGRGHFQMPALPTDETNEVQSGEIQFFLDLD